MQSALFDIILFFSEAEENHHAPETTIDALLFAGFQPQDIKKALQWRNSFFSELPSIAIQPKSSIRIYNQRERNVLGENGLELLCHLEDEGLIDEGGREFLIRHAMTLDFQEIPLPYFIWMVYVLLDQRGNHDYAEFLAQLIAGVEVA